MPLGWVMGSLMFAINYVTSSRFLPVFFKKFDLQVKANRAAWMEGINSQSFREYHLSTSKPDGSQSRGAALEPVEENNNTLNFCDIQGPFK